MTGNEMNKLKKVVKVEMTEEVFEVVKKTTRKDYARGGFKLEETIVRTTVQAPAALLECGHWRQEYHYGTVIKTAPRLSCWRCEEIEREQKATGAESSNHKITGSSGESE
jgi:hypothetical protein